MLTELILLAHIFCSVAALAISGAVAMGKIIGRGAAFTMFFLSLLSGAVLYAMKGTLPEMSALLHVVLYVTAVMVMLYGKQVYLDLLKLGRILL